MSAAVLLLASLLLLFFFLRKDAAEYAAFQVLTRTEDRQRCYRRWAIKSFATLSGMAFVSLALLRRIDTLSNMPQELLPISAHLHQLVPPATITRDGSFLGGFLGAVVGGLVIGIVVSACSKKMRKYLEGSSSANNIQPMMPRNAAETAWTTLLSLNAGFSEELFFRLLLPLLLVILFGSPLIAVVLATIFFGVAHLYQGPLGVLLTTVLGAVFMLLYLWTGNLWIAAAAHAALDLMNLVIRPTLMRALATKERAR